MPAGAPDQYPGFNWLLSTFIQVSIPFGQTATDVKIQMLISARQLYPEIFLAKGANAAFYHLMLAEWQATPWWPPAP